MNIIKESTGKVCVIRTETYKHSLGHLLMLFEEAKKDFPGLKAEDVQVVKYSGSRYAKTLGIEFKNPHSETCPAGYKPINQLELTI